MKKFKNSKRCLKKIAECFKGISFSAINCGHAFAAFEKAMDDVNNIMKKKIERMEKEMASTIDPVFLALNKLGFDSFRPKQEEIIRTMVSGKDTISVLPTGAGKSLCFQLPAILLPGLTIVISPLISLMCDQVENALKRGIRASTMFGALTKHQKEFIASGARNGRIKLLYVSPEMFISKSFIKIIEKVKLSLVVIDEAHCISWGDTFRPAYVKIKKELEKEIFQGVPKSAFTASATSSTITDIEMKFALESPVLFRTTFNRPNIFYDVREKGFTGVEDLIRLLSEKKKTTLGLRGIIYCNSRLKCDDVSTVLNLCGFSSLPYHAGLDDKVRAKNHKMFSTGKVKIMVATIAYGMGIDIADIRYVVHLDLPKDIEGYYQETGRAGRDGLKSTCCLLFSRADKMDIRKFIDQIQNPILHAVATKKMESVVSYAEDDKCRRASILEYFGEKYGLDNCGTCDVCIKMHKKNRFKKTYPVKKLFGGGNGKA